MKNHNPPVVKTPYTPPEPEKAKLVEEMWLCEACGQDKLGILKDGVLHIKYRERSIVAEGIVKIPCRKCSYVNTMDTRARGFTVNLILSDNLANGIEPPEKPAPQKKRKKAKKS